MRREPAPLQANRQPAYPYPTIVPNRHPIAMLFGRVRRQEACGCRFLANGPTMSSMPVLLPCRQGLPIAVDKNSSFRQQPGRRAPYSYMRRVGSTPLKESKLSFGKHIDGRGRPRGAKNGALGKTSARAECQCKRLACHQTTGNSGAARFGVASSGSSAPGVTEVFRSIHCRAVAATQ